MELRAESARLAAFWRSALGETLGSAAFSRSFEVVFFCQRTVGSVGVHHYWCTTSIVGPRVKGIYVDQERLTSHSGTCCFALDDGAREG